MTKNAALHAEIAALRKEAEGLREAVRLLANKCVCDNWANALEVDANPIAKAALDAAGNTNKENTQ